MARDSSRDIGLASRRRSRIVSQLEEILEVRHNCTLQPEPDPIVLYINEGYFVYCRRKFRRFCTVSENNPRTKVYLKSRRAVRREKIRHMRYYTFMLHPFSIIRQIWELIIVCVIILSLICTPIAVVYENYIHYSPEKKTYEEDDDNKRSTLSQIRLWFCMPMLALDIILRFFTGYCKYETKEIILSPRKVARNYALGALFVNILSMLPMDIILTKALHQYVHSYDNNQIFFHLAASTNLFQVIALHKYLDNVRDWLQWSHFKVKVFKLFFTYFTYWLWLSAYLQIFDTLNDREENNSDRPSVGEHFLQCCYRCVYVLLLVGYGFTASHNYVEKSVEMLSLIAGTSLRFVLVSITLQTINKYGSSTTKYQTMKQQLHEFIRYKMLPDYFRKRIIHYYEFRYRRQYLRENEIMGILSAPVKQEITMYMCQRLIEKVIFFKNIPWVLLLRIMKCMKQEFYLPNDIIVIEGTVGDAMYFIANGTVAVFVKTGKEICHLEDGDNFGEIALVIEGESRTASVVAVEPCEVFYLSRKDFQQAVQPYPRVMERIRNIAFERYHSTRSVVNQDNNN